MTAGAARRLLPAALMTFAAGVLFGWVAGRWEAAPPPRDLSPDLASYEDALIRALDLGGGQQKDLRLLLLYYEQERRRLLASQRLELEPLLAANDQRFYELIKTRVLRPEQRRRARTLMRPLAVAGSARRLPEAHPAVLPGTGDGR